MNIIYTANIGGYDKVSPIPKKFRDGWKCLYFSDDPNTTPDGWDFCDWDKSLTEGLPPVGVAKYIKIMSHKVLPDGWDRCLWIDGNRDVTGDLNDFIKTRNHELYIMAKMNQKLSIYKAMRDLMPRGSKDHKTYRNYLEINDIENKIKDTMEYYKSSGMKPLDGPISETSIVIRKNTKQNIRINELWWDEFMRFGIWRDEPPLRFVLWKENVKIGSDPKRSICSHHTIPLPKRWFHHNTHNIYKPENSKRPEE